MIVTLLTGAPVGVHVVDGVEDTWSSVSPTATRAFVTLQGDREQIPRGELIWRAGDTVLTRRWVHKQGAAGSVTEASVLFAINVDFLGDDDVDAAVELLTDWLGVAGILVSDVVTLDRATVGRARHCKST
jgi:DNA/RNA-binding domain of Phe-tRNA-synthetase-like protein